MGALGYELKCACSGGGTVPLGFVSPTKMVMTVALSLWMLIQTMTMMRSWLSLTRQGESQLIDSDKAYAIENSHFKSETGKKV